MTTTMTGTAQGRWPGRWRCVGTVLLAVLVWGSPALLWAHARLLRSFPMSNSLVTQAPTVVRCWFSEPIEVRFSTITISRASKDAATGVLRPQERIDQGWQEGLKVTPEVAVVLPSPLPPGLYLVQWTVFAVDGHKASGTFSWTYQPAPAGDGPPPSDSR